MAINYPSRLWWLWFDICRFPRTLWFRWTHRKETPEQREQRIAETVKKFRAIYNASRAEYDASPDSKALMEWRRDMDAMMDEILGKEES
jgi:hypothetical protein